MILDGPLLPGIAVGTAWVLLGLASWERAAHFRQNGASPRAAKEGTDLQPSLEVRLVAWLFFGCLLWLRAGLEAAAPLRGIRAALLLAVGIPLAGAALLAGRARARSGEFPVLLRWPLAPFHGLSVWIFWLLGLLAARRPGFARPLRSGIAPGPASADQRVRDLASISLEEVMIPRSQVVALEAGRTLREAMPEVRRRPHSIYPVYEGEIDQPLGVVRILELTEPDAVDRPLRERVRAVPILPETVRGLKLLGDLRRAPIPAALVVDEFGGVAGLVTIEDLMEVLIGDLEGEHEVVRARILSEADGNWRIDGACTVEEFNRRFGPLLPEGEYETVAGLILDRLGEVPEVGEEVALPEVRLEVLQRSPRRLLWLRAEIRSAEARPLRG